MGRIRKANDIMAECIEMVHEYKQTIEYLNAKIERLNVNNDYWKTKTQRAVDSCNEATDTLEEIADIIAGFTEHTDGYIKVYLSNLIPENAVKLERLFKLLDIPMTADQIKEGGKDEEN